MYIMIANIVYTRHNKRVFASNSVEIDPSNLLSSRNIYYSTLTSQPAILPTEWTYMTYAAIKLHF